jgi:hypothetical protein
MPCGSYFEIKGVEVILLADTSICINSLNHRCIYTQHGINVSAGVGPWLYTVLKNTYHACPPPMCMFVPGQAGGEEILAAEGTTHARRPLGMAIMYALINLAPFDLL